MDSNFLSRYDIKDFVISLPSGDVYKAIDTKFKKNALIKIIDLSINKEKIDIENLKNRFYRYVSNVSKLIHPNIISTNDFFIGEDNKLYTVNEYFDIKNSLISKELLFDMSLNAKLKFAISLAEALDFAHNLKILHQNLYIDSIYCTNETVKVDNFDLKRYLAKNSLISELGIYSSPPPYIPPEYISNYDPTVYGDIFQIGCIL